MSLTLQSTIVGQIGWTWRDHAGAAAIVDSSQLTFRLALGDGAAAGQCDAVWHLADQVLAAGGTRTFDLGALERTLFGAETTLALAAVKALLIVNRSAAAWLTVGAAVNGEWYAPFGTPGGTVRVMPQSPLLLANTQGGWPVTVQGAALQIVAAGGEATFDIALLGIRAA